MLATGSGYGTVILQCILSHIRVCEVSAHPLMTAFKHYNPDRPLIFKRRMSFFKRRMSFLLERHVALE